MKESAPWCVDRLQYFRISAEDSDDGHEIVTGPPALKVGVGRSEGSAKGKCSVEASVMDFNLSGRKRKGIRRLAESPEFVRISER